MDGSGPPRANAAQLAQRNIKALKGRSVNRARAGPVQSPSPAFGQSQSAPAAQPFQFQPPASSNGGAFNFSFGGGNNGANNPFANSNGQQLSENDERRDPAEERDTKKRWIDNGKGDSVPLFAPMPQQPSNVFGGQQQINGAQNGGLFSTGFGGNTGMDIQAPQASTPTPAIFSGFGQSQPSSNVFNTAQSFPPTTSFNFGASSQPQPASSSFTFGQTTEQPKSTGFTFGATAPATNAPATNLFGTSQAPSTNLFATNTSTPSTGFSFGQKDTNPAPSTNLFGASTQPPTSNLFAISSSAASNVFSSKEASPAPQANASTFFGNSSQAPSKAAETNLFGNKEASPAPTTNTNNPFGSTSNLFASSASTAGDLVGRRAENNFAPPAATNLFGSSTPSANPFANKVATPAPASVANVGTPSSEQPKPVSNLFGQTTQQPASTSQVNLFGSVNQPASNALFGEKIIQSTPTPFDSLNQPSPASKPFDTAPTPTITSGFQFNSIPKPNGSDLFGNLNKPVDQAVTDPSPSKPLFGTSITQTAPTPLFEQQKPSNGVLRSDMSSVSAAPSASAPTADTAPTKPLFSFGSSQGAPPPTPQPSKITLFNAGKPLDAPSSAISPVKAVPSSLQNTQAVPNVPSSSTEKTSAGELMSDAIRRLEGTNPLEAPKHDGTNLCDLGIARQITEQYMKDLVPSEFDEEQRKDFYCAYRLRALNRAMAVFFGGLQSSADPFDAIKLYTGERRLLLDDLTSRATKKLNGQATPSNPTRFAQIQPSKPAEGVWARSPTRAAPTPAKQQVLPSAPTPRVNGAPAFQSTAAPLTQVPALPSPTKNLAPSSSSGKRKAEDNLDKDNADQMNKRPMRKIATPSRKISTESPGGSTTSNIFKSILDSPSKSPKKTASLPGAPSSANETPKANPFGSLFVPKSTSKIDSPSAPAKEVEKPKPVNESASAPAPSFGFKPSGSVQTGGFTPSTSTTFGSTSATSSVPAPTGGFKVSGFPSTGSVNFATSFGKSESGENEAESAALKAAIDKDYDSDEETLPAFKARFKKEYQERIAKYAAAATTSSTGFAFQANKPSATTSEVTKLAATASTTLPSIEKAQTNKTLFSFGAPSQITGNSFLSPANLSRASSASPAPSSTGSVLDGHAPGKPVTFSNNIFGHLSAGDSGKSDADDENGDDADSESDPEADADSENKDPNYTPGQDSGPATPGTPVEETGAGIASAKKSGLFTFTPSKTSSIFGGPSGTSTPGGSLFGRITRDTSAKPAVPSSEEKENTKPAATGLFASLNKPQNQPSDQTWKIDSPIKFGSATPGNDPKPPPPTVNVTAATPTKTATSIGLFSNLNSSSGPTSAPFSNLFGSSSTPKQAAAPSVGFNFGGVSNTSSLFPSATTSRATTPGATTDGDSAAEDPVAEKHEQISLTTGAGEEDETVEFEVRCKAQHFAEQDDGTKGWVVKGMGPLRILKHKDTGATRVLLRAEPRGSVVLNKGILGNLNYEPVKKTVKFVCAGDDGKSLETWLIQVKTEDLAKELAEALEANKTT